MGIYCVNMKDLARICAVLVILPAVAVQDTAGDCPKSPIGKTSVKRVSDQCFKNCCTRDIRKIKGRCDTIYGKNSKGTCEKVGGQFQKMGSSHVCRLCKSTTCDPTCASSKYTCYQCDYEKGCTKVACSMNNCGHKWNNCRVAFH